MRFPIDKKRVDEIPALEPLHRFPDPMAKAVLLAFDPSIRANPIYPTPEARRRVVEEMSGYSPPNPPENGEDPSEEYMDYIEALDAALSLQDNMDYRMMAVLEMSIDRMLSIMLRASDGDSLKNVETYAKCGTALDNIRNQILQVREAMAASDERLKKAIADGTSTRRKSISPEK